MPAGYRPPPPAASAYFAIQYSANEAINTPSTFLPRIPSKTPVSHFAENSVQYATPPATRNSSASNIAALPSLSSGLNRLNEVTSMEQLSIHATRSCEGEEALRRLVQSNSKRATSKSMLQVHQIQDDAQRFMKYDDDDSDSDSSSDEDDEACQRQRRQPQPQARPTRPHLISRNSSSISSPTSPGSSRASSSSPDLKPTVVPSASSSLSSSNRTRSFNSSSMGDHGLEYDNGRQSTSGLMMSRKRTKSSFSMA